MGLVGVRMLDQAGNPYSMANPLPIVATISSTHLDIATQTSAPIEISATKATNTASNPIFVHVATNTSSGGEAVNISTNTAGTPGLVNIATVTTTAPILINVNTNTAGTPGLVNINTITTSAPILINLNTQTSAPIEISANKSTNTAANPIFVSQVGASGATDTTITAYNVTSTANAIVAAAGRITLTLQNADTLTTIFIGNTSTVSPTTTGNNLELLPRSSFEDEDWTGVLYAIVPTGSTAILKAYEVVA